MRLSLMLLSSTIFLTSQCTPALTHVHRGPTSHRPFNKKSSKTSTKSASQRSIDSERVTQIQTALIRAGYLGGDATGHWDADTETAMQKFQAANGWQTKLTPDSRAIIKLGLGPSAGVEKVSSNVVDNLPLLASSVGNPSQ